VIYLAGSKNNKKIKPEVIVDTIGEPLDRSTNTLQDFMSSGKYGAFTSKMFSDGIIQEVKAEDLKKYMSNPDVYHKELEKIATYYYISNGDVFQLFDLAKVLPTLNYKIEVDEKTKTFEANLSTCNKVLTNTVKHKSLTRDLISQVITSGTLIGLWLGDKKKPYLYVFDDLEFVFPAYRKQGEWVAWIDLAWFDSMTQVQRDAEFENLSPFVTVTDYENYKTDRTKCQYVELPLERTVVLRTHTTSRNQRLGVGWATQGFYDIIHKKKLKDMETTVANKIINAVAVLTIGSETGDKTANLQLDKNLKRKVFGAVKTALDKGNSQGVTCIALPEWGKLDFPDLKSEALSPDKYQTVNSDIEQSTGVGGAMKGSSGGTFASDNINIETFYKRIAVLLEEIESEVYSKLFKILLPSSISSNYRMLYDKLPPLSLKEKVEILTKLHSEGFSIKAILDCLGIDFVTYIAQTEHEQNELNLPNKIKPYQTSSTLSSNGTGKPTSTTPTENTGGNKLPSA
jgi:hypothetical protein